MGGATSTVHGPRLRVDGGADAMAAVEVDEKIVEAIGDRIVPPQMMVGVNDGQVRIDYRLSATLQPLVVDVVLPDVGGSILLLTIGHTCLHVPVVRHRVVLYESCRAEGTRWKTCISSCGRESPRVGVERWPAHRRKPASPAVIRTSPSPSPLA